MGVVVPFQDIVRARRREQERVCGERCIEIIEKAVTDAGGSLGDVVRTRVYLTPAADFEDFGRAHGEAFSEIRPANTTVVVAALVDPRWLLEIEAEAVVGQT